MEIDLERNSHKFAGIEDIENSLAFSCGPDDPDDSPSTQDRTASFLQALQWIRNASNARSKEIRVQVVYYYFSGGSKLSPVSQVRLAKEIGVTKAAISQQAVAFQDYFAEKTGTKETMERVSMAVGMRSGHSRQTFAKVCKSNHQKKKSSSGSNESQTRSTPNSVKQSDLRAKVLAAGGLQ